MTWNINKIFGFIFAISVVTFLLNNDIKELRMTEEEYIKYKKSFLKYFPFKIKKTIKKPSKSRMYLSLFIKVLFYLIALILIVID